MKTSVKQVIAVIALVAIIAASLSIAAFGMAETNANEQPDEIWDGSIAEGFAGGTGTEADPYLISNGAELAYLAQQVNGGNNFSGVYFKLTNDICLNDTSNWESWEDGVAPQNEWTAIGGYNVYEEVDFRFKGCFDGDSYAVRGIYNTHDYYCPGLFGGIVDGSIIANLGVAESYIWGYESVGSVVGYNCGDVINCYNAGSVSGESLVVGGVVGENYGNVINCYNEGSVVGNSNVGGVIGHNNGTVANCYNTGIVNGSSWHVGGVVGDNYEGNVTDCYSTGSISGEDTIGGVVGNNNFGVVTDCYSTGSISGEDTIGGVVGDNCCGVVTDCYSTGSISGEETIGGVVGENGSGDVTNCYNIGSVTGGSYVGGVVGENGAYATVTNCYNTGSVTGLGSVGDEGESSWGVGGVVGFNAAEEWDASVVNCYNSGSVTGENSVGGVVGQINGESANGYAENCYNIGSVTGSGNVGGVVGGISGYSGNGYAENCYNTGSVTGENSVGGVVGGIFGYSTNCYAENCYNVGSVTGTENVGGMAGSIGDNINVEVTNCYYLDTCCESGDEYAVALTDEQMQAEASFVGFDFETVWTMEGNQAYPYPELISNPHIGSAVPGDLDGDGEITTIDANMVLRIALYLEDYNSNGDVDNDGTVTLADANTILRWALGF